MPMSPEPRNPRSVLGTGMRYIKQHLTVLRLQLQKISPGLPRLYEKTEIYIDALSKQLDVVITQGNRPIALFSRKLVEEQQMLVIIT